MFRHNPLVPSLPVFSSFVLSSCLVRAQFIRAQFVLSLLVLSSCPVRPCSARPCPAPFLLELQRERRETTKLGYLGRCRRQPPKTHGPCSDPPVAKSLVYSPGPRSSWGDRTSSPPRFNTYSRNSTHLGAAWPTSSFFLSFDSLTVGIPISNLKPGHWDLRPELVGIQDSRLSK
jgi:hypothetical protein